MVTFKLEYFLLMFAYKFFKIVTFGFDVLISNWLDDIIESTFLNAQFLVALP